ncbi:protein-tyrosine phosphatase-like protein [Hyaloraphidium curvatum]|nr:protein-tyrosine phosphatase-like protein [Hyaloraphidium curvatum]
MEAAAEPRTSVTHPLSISWVLPEALVERAAGPLATAERDILDALIEAGPRACSPAAALAHATPLPLLDAGGNVVRGPARPLLPGRRRGNLALSSMPGKRVRVESGPVNGRASVKRDLALDFCRLAALGFRAVVCCIGAEEMDFLGAPLARYEEVARSNAIEVVRIPLVEGSHPDRPSDLDPVLERIREVTDAGGNVLVHCRGGLGRAGVVACCYLLRTGLIRSKLPPDDRDDVPGPWSRSLRYDQARAMETLGESMRTAPAYAAKQGASSPRRIAGRWTEGPYAVPAAERNARELLADGDLCGRTRVADGIEWADAVACDGSGSCRFEASECDASARAIQYVRLRRSHKAIETRQQEAFIHEYARYLRHC